MQALITFLTVVGGLIFSVAVAIVVEEFIFGQIFKTSFPAAHPSPRQSTLTRPVTQWAAQPVGMTQISPR